MRHLVLALSLLALAGATQASEGPATLLQCGVKLGNTGSAYRAEKKSSATSARLARFGATSVQTNSRRGHAVRNFETLQIKNSDNSLKLPPIFTVFNIGCSW